MSKFKIIALPEHFTRQAIKRFVSVYSLGVFFNPPLHGIYAIRHEGKRIPDSLISYAIMRNKVIQVTSFSPGLKAASHYFSGASRASFILSIDHFSRRHRLDVGTPITLTTHKSVSHKFYERLPLFGFKGRPYLEDDINYTVGGFLPKLSLPPYYVETW
jgi:hypothetical protein